MKHLSAFILIVVAGLGCGLWDRAQESATGNSANTENANKTLTDRAVDAAVGEEKIGVKECDEVVDFFNSQTSDPDDDLVTKAAKATILKKLKGNFKKAVEENKTDKAQLAKTCREFKANLDRFKTEQENSNKE